MDKTETPGDDPKSKVSYSDLSSLRGKAKKKLDVIVKTSGDPGTQILAEDRHAQSKDNTKVLFEDCKRHATKFALFLCAAFILFFSYQLVRIFQSYFNFLLAEPERVSVFVGELYRALGNSIPLAYIMFIGNLFITTRIERGLRKDNQSD